MSKYLYLFRGGDAGRAAESPETMEQHMELWKNWMGGLAGNGQLVDGLPLAQGGKVVEKAGDSITDGPFAEGNEIVGGYLIVNAGDISEAVEISKGCPIFEHEGTVEVREIMSM